MLRWFRLRLLTWLLSPRRAAMKRAVLDSYSRLVGRKPTVTLYYEVGDPHSHLCAQLLFPMMDQVKANFEVVIVPPPPERYRPNSEARANYLVEDAGRIAPSFGLRFPENSRPAAPELIEEAAHILVAADKDCETFLEVERQLAESLWFDRNKKTEGEPLPEDLARMTEKTTQTRLKRNALRMNRRGIIQAPGWYLRGEWYQGLDRFRQMEIRLKAIAALPENAKLPQVREKQAALGSGHHAANVVHCYFRPEDPNGYLALRQLEVLKSRYPISVEYHLLEASSNDPDLQQAAQALLYSTGSLLQLRDAARDAVWRGIVFGKMAPLSDRAAWKKWFKLAVGQKKAAEFVLATAQAQWAARRDLGKEKTLRKVIKDLTIEPSTLEPIKKAEEITWTKQVINDSSGWTTPMFRLGDFVVHGRDRLWLIGELLRRKFNPDKAAPRKRF